MHPGLRRQHGRRKRRSGPGTTTDICLFSASGLDTSMAYTVTEIGDVTVIAIWSAVMYPYAPAPGTFNGARPS